ncbi:ABC transporter permease subunit [Priestia taiwanensis]|uniref:Acetoin ABC transporter permease n=1 Tax=Priestia taiwanensis TaxID=1347902 RepID=A0A917EJT5_9BACI|nr:ABC transporter permease subunit [Priestia taiwanensis]MBM7361470.1 ABC-type transport system involved in multi-copper enzyme maturation permease subunit [Priestia taiwanensis]GGE54418.1 acetoin ABC transporter permease [Priestia taiwanensis]
MFHKVLWLHNWKQSKFAILAMWIVIFFSIPFDYLTLVTRNYEQRADGFMDPIYYGKGFSLIAPLAITIVLALFAAFLLNGKRNNGSLKFQFSLPFSRKELFLAKWFFGAVHILLALIGNIIITIITIQTSFIRNYEDISHWPMYFLFASFAYVGIYSVCLFVGTFTGRIISQVLLSFLLLFIGQTAVMLIRPFIQVLLQKPDPEFYIDSFHLINITTLPTMMYEYHFWNTSTYDGSNPTDPLSYFKVEYPSYDTLIAATIITGLSIFIGSFIFSRNKLERNGQFLLFKKLEPFYIALITVIVALVGGALSNGSSYLYFLYFFGFGIVMFFILRLLFKRNSRFLSQQST